MASAQTGAERDRRFKLTEDQERAALEEYRNGSTANQVAARFGVSPWVILIAAKRSGFSKPRGGRIRSFTENQLSDIRTSWLAGEAQWAIGQRYGASQTMISRVLRLHGFIPESRLRKAERHRWWKGGRVVLGNGYAGVRVELNDPMRSMCDQNGYVLEHRLVMARTLGRPLTSDETVHHINGDRIDNRPENLQLRQGRHGKGAAFRCADCGSCNVVAAPLNSEN